MSNDKTARIRELNDLFRKTSQGGQILMTHGVSNFNHETIGRIAEAVKNYDDFSTDNDPYSEHDFGSFEIDEHTILENRLLHAGLDAWIGRRWTCFTKVESVWV